MRWHVTVNQNDWGDWKFALVGTGGGLKVAFSAGVLIALHAAGIVFGYILGTSGTAIAFAEYVATNCRSRNIVNTFLEIEKIGPKAVFNTLHMLRDIILYSLRDYPFWRKIMRIAWQLGEAIVIGVFRKRPRPSIDGIRSLVGRINARRLVAAATEFQITVHYRAKNGSPDRHTLVSNHDKRFDPDHGGRPEDILEDIIGSASFPPFIPNPDRFDGFCFGEGLHEAMRRANIVIVPVNDQPRADERTGFLPDLMKAFATMYDRDFKKEVAEVLKNNPHFTVWTGDSTVPYIAEITAAARDAGRYGMSDHCLLFPTPEFLIGELCTFDLAPGDLSTAIQHGMNDVGKKMANELRETYKRYHPTNNTPAA